MNATLLPSPGRYCAILAPFRLFDWHAEAPSSVWLDSLYVAQVRTQPELTSASLIHWGPARGTLWATQLVLFNSTPAGLTASGPAFVAGARPLQLLPS